MTAWGRMMNSAINGFHTDSETSLIRMFRIEYGPEYRYMKKMGYEITDENVKAFLGLRK